MAVRRDPDGHHAHHLDVQRDARVSLPIDSILWTLDGIEYLRPEVQLLHKANSLRPKDRDDFAVCLPLLDPPARQWLQSALEVAHPGHTRLAEL